MFLSAWLSLFLSASKKMQKKYKITSLFLKTKTITFNILLLKKKKRAFILLKKRKYPPALNFLSIFRALCNIPRPLSSRQTLLITVKRIENVSLQGLVHLSWKKEHLSSKILGCDWLWLDQNWPIREHYLIQYFGDGPNLSWNAKYTRRGIAKTYGQLLRMVYRVAAHLFGTR